MHERHGLTKTPEYSSWCAMKKRCLNPNSKFYKNYGGRGIAVCERWRLSFTDFLEDMGRCPDGKTTIDRIDSEGGYVPENCRWTERTRQGAENTKRLRPVEVCGKRFLSVNAACRHYKISNKTVYQRMRRGWDLNSSFCIPVDRARWPTAAPILGLRHERTAD